MKKTHYSTKNIAMELYVELDDVEQGFGVFGILSSSILVVHLSPPICEQYEVQDL